MDEKKFKIIKSYEPKDYSTEEWDKIWSMATSPDHHDSVTEGYYAQFRACIQAEDDHTFLCVHKDKSVCIDGNPDKLNTFFRVVHLFSPEEDFHQITCNSGHCANYVLYVEDEQLKARPFSKNLDLISGNEMEKKAIPTLFKFRIDCGKNVYIDAEAGEYSFSKKDADATDNARIVLKKSMSYENISFDVTVVKVK